MFRMGDMRQKLHIPDGEREEGLLPCNINHPITVFNIKL